MKKSITKMLAVGLCAAMVVLTGCGASETTGNTNAAEKTDSAQSEAAPEKNGEKKKVALICDVAGTQVFVLNMIEGLKARNMDLKRLWLSVPMRLHMKTTAELWWKRAPI